MIQGKQYNFQQILDRTIKSKNKHLWKVNFLENILLFEWIQLQTLVAMTYLLSAHKLSSSQCYN